MTTIVLHGIKAPSWNTLYTQSHWSKRRKLADEMHTLVRAHIPADAPLYDVPVHITVTACYKRTPVDCDNVASKLLIDSLKGIVLCDDNPACVRSVTTISKQAKRECVVIEIRPVDEE